MTGRPRIELLEVTDRQREVARLIAEGYTNERIAEELGISLAGAKYHVSELLGRLGVSRRTEIAEWYRAQDEQRPHRQIRGMFGAPAMGWVVAGCLTALATVGLYLGLSGALDGGPSGDATETPSSGATPVRVELGPVNEPTRTDLPTVQFGDDWESAAVQRIGGRELVLFSYWVAPAPAPRSSAGGIRILDRGTREWVAELWIGRFPLVARLDVPGGFLVFDAPWWGQEEIRPRALRYSLANGMTLESALSLPEGSPWWGTGSPPERGVLTISKDEQYVYYLDAENVVHVISLGGGMEVVSVHSLPRRCAGTAIYSFGPSTVAAVCRWNNEDPVNTGIIRIVAPSGPVGPDIVAEGLAGYLEGQDSWPIPVIAATNLPDGIGVLYADGTFAIANGAAIRIVGRALPDGRWALSDWQGDVLQMDGGRLLIPYVDRATAVAGDRPAVGFVVFNTGSLETEHHIEVENHGTVAISDSEVVLLNPGRIDIVDLSAGRITESFDASHPESPQALPMVR